MTGFFGRPRRIVGIIGLAAVILLSACATRDQSEPTKPNQTPFSPTTNTTSIPETPVVGDSTSYLAPILKPSRAEQITKSPPESAAIPPPSPTSIQPPSPTPIQPAPTLQYPQYEGTPLIREKMGIQTHIHHEDMRSILRHLQALEVGWVKVQVSWKLYQPAPDRYAEDRLAELDALVDGANGNGIKVLINISKAPEWSRSTTQMDGPPLDFSLYEDFMSFLAARYRGRVAAYELWNEPNLQREWNGEPLDPTALVRLIEFGAKGIRNADLDALIISAAPATTGINDGRIALDDRQYLQGMLDAGIAASVDALGVHPYGWANSPDSSFINPDESAISHNDHPSFFFLDTLEDYRAILNENGVNLPLWVTEFGWGSFDEFVDDSGNPAAPPQGVAFMSNVSEEQQALYILRAFELAQSKDYVGPMILWNLNFGPLLGSDFSESGYSILRPDNVRRPAYLSLENAAKR